MSAYLFTSARLGFRYWENEDTLPFCEMCRDPKVMEFFSGTLSNRQSEEMIIRIKKHFAEKGYGLYAVDRLDTQSFIGFIGFSTPSFETSFTPCTEIGWRLQHDAWGQGFATEGAIRCLEYGFATFHFPEIYSFTAVINKRSEQVMIKAGMQKTGYFDHPLVPDHSPLLRHILYKMVPATGHL